MIVYSDRRERLDTRTLLRDLACRIEAAATERDEVVALLIDAGVLETGVTDALSPERDEVLPLPSLLRGVTVDLARALVAAEGQRRHLAAAVRRLRAAERGPLPVTVEVSEPEGFAFYALDLAMHAEAARAFAREIRPDAALCIGLRSIGTTLAAVVVAALEAEGVATTSLTLRPRGHPFEREVQLGPHLAGTLAEAARGYVLIADEGPGLSGSSLAAAADAASRAGFPEDRIVLMPSWEPEAAQLRSARARDRWTRHPRRVAFFEATVLPDLAAPWGGGPLRDLGGGLWRDLHDWEDEPPAVQPQHERRKYLLERPGAEPLLLRFVGLGRRGERALARARRLACARLGPQPSGLARGFLGQVWLSGKPARPRNLDRAMIEAMAGQVATLARLEATAAPPRFDDLVAMIRVNATEALGPRAADPTTWMDSLRSAALARTAIAGDGRMAPHEWLLTPKGLVKTDGLDHHNDHFWPGCQDAAWDLAGAVVEWNLDRPARAALVEAYEARSGDRGVRAVLPLNEAAYLAWRLGYATLAAESLVGTEDGRHMATLRDRLAALLPHALEGAPW